MKFPVAFATLLLSTVVVAEQTCTHGKLFVSDLNSTNVFVFDVSTGKVENLTPETSITVNGGPGSRLEFTESGKEVAAIFQGTKELGYADGAVTFIDTGVSAEFHGDHYDVEYVPPSIVSNAGVDCNRPIHFVRHDDKIAIFCDGSFDFDPQINSTLWVVDETKFGTDDESAIIYTETLQGSHHGVAIPVDDNHVLYSLASEDRINRVPETSSLPATFQVVDYQGMILHSIADESSPDTSCLGFHGESVADNTFTLACNAEHGGILIVDYEEPGMSYTSRALSYPASFEEHRTGTFREHPKSEFIVGNFAGQGMFHLMAFQDDDTALTDNQILTLEARQCDFSFEHGEADIVLVLMPTGVLHAFEFENDAWQEAANVQVVEGMQDCSEAFMVPGVGHAFVMTTTDNTLFAVDLEHVHEGEMEVFASPLDFTPAEATVGGVPMDVACTQEEPDHDHSSDDEDPDGSSASAKPVSVITAFLIVATVLLF